MSESDEGEFQYNSAQQGHAHRYLWPCVRKILAAEFSERQNLFDLGCGNGSTANMLAELGWQVTGVDLSESGILQAKCQYPQCQFYEASAYDELSKIYGQFQAVVSLEVVEHLYYPRRFARNLFDLVRSDGVAVVSTPYHGYFKNLALAVSGKLDRHFTALWDGGHIKFWSQKTLTILLLEAGFTEIRFHGVGRFPGFSNSMIAVARK